MTRRSSRNAPERATDREVGVVAAILIAGSEKAAAHRLGLSHSTVKHHLASARSKVGAETTAQLVWILAPRLREAQGTPQADGPGRGGLTIAPRMPPAFPAGATTSHSVRPSERESRRPTDLDGEPKPESPERGLDHSASAGRSARRG